MSTAMEIIKRANRENRGIVIILSGAKEMGTRIPICVRVKANNRNGSIQETSHHGEKLTLEVDLRNSNNKVAYVCDENHTKVKVSEFLFTDSVKEGLPVYAYISAHVFTSFDELNITRAEPIPLIPEVKNAHYMSEW